MRGDVRREYDPSFAKSANRYGLTDSEDEDIGPLPPPRVSNSQESSEGVKAFLELEERRMKGLQVNFLHYYNGFDSFNHI